MGFLMAKNQRTRKVPASVSATASFLQKSNLITFKVDHKQDPHDEVDNIQQLIVGDRFLQPHAFWSTPVCAAMANTPLASFQA